MKATETVGIWDSHSGECLNILEGHYNEVIFSIYSPDGNKIFSASENGSVRIWDSRSGLSLFESEYYPNVVYSGKFSPDSSQVLVLTSENIQILDSKTGKLVKVLIKESYREPFYNRKFSNNNNHIDYSPNGNQILTLSNAGNVRVWNEKDGEYLFELDTLPDTKSVYYTSDGKHIVAMNNSVWRSWYSVFNSENGEYMNCIEMQHAEEFSLISYVSNCELFWTTMGGIARIWDVQAGDCIHILPHIPGLYVQNTDFRGAIWESSDIDEFKKTLTQYGAIVE